MAGMAMGTRRGTVFVLGRLMILLSMSTWRHLSPAASPGRIPVYSMSGWSPSGSMPASSRSSIISAHATASLFRSKVADTLLPPTQTSALQVTRRFPCLFLIDAIPSPGKLCVNFGVNFTQSVSKKAKISKCSKQPIKNKTALTSCFCLLMPRFHWCSRQDSNLRHQD